METLDAANSLLRFDSLLLIFKSGHLFTGLKSLLL